MGIWAKLFPSVLLAGLGKEQLQNSRRGKKAWPDSRPLEQIGVEILVPLERPHCALRVPLSTSYLICRTEHKRPEVASTPYGLLLSLLLEPSPPLSHKIEMLQRLDPATCVRRWFQLCFSCSNYNPTKQNSPKVARLNSTAFTAPRHTSTVSPDTAVSSATSSYGWLMVLIVSHGKLASGLSINSSSPVSPSVASTTYFVLVSSSYQPPNEREPFEIRFNRELFDPRPSSLAGTLAPATVTEGPLPCSNDDLRLRF